MRPGVRGRQRPWRTPPTAQLTSRPAVPLEVPAPAPLPSVRFRSPVAGDGITVGAYYVTESGFIAIVEPPPGRSHSSRDAAPPLVSLPHSPGREARGRCDDPPGGRGAHGISGRVRSRPCVHRG